MKPGVSAIGGRSMALAWSSGPVMVGGFIPVVTLLNAVVGMLLPRMMTPPDFGEYALVVTLFNYGLITDLGMSQLIDRQIPAYLGSGRADLARAFGDKMLWLRLAIGVTIFAATTLALTAIDVTRGLPFSLLAGVLAAMAGLANMVAQGPTCIYRARSDRRNYAIFISILLSGLIFARLGGLIAGGLVGCFAAMAAWYLAWAVVTHRRMPLNTTRILAAREALSLISVGVPYFATSFVWAFYVTGNRWFASFLIEPAEFGQFAFSANIFSLLVGSAGGFSAFYYPKIVERIARSGDHAVSRVLLWDLTRLITGTAVLMTCGIVLSGFLIRMIYPMYLPGVQTARVILVAVPPMVLASWLMPISLSSSKRPFLDGLISYPMATAILGLAIFILYRSAGDQGVAWASTASAVPLVAIQLVTMRQAKILHGRDALLLFLATAGVSVALGGLAWRINA